MSRNGEEPISAPTSSKTRTLTRFKQDWAGKRARGLWRQSKWKVL
jgi:hypothetical protein